VPGHPDLRGRIGGLTRRGARPEKIEAARAELAEANAEAAIKRIVDGWPPLTPAQRERLALLLHPGAGDGT
jgi:hypothetical protein